MKAQCLQTFIENSVWAISARFFLFYVTIQASAVLTLSSGMHGKEPLAIIICSVFVCFCFYVFCFLFDFILGFKPQPC